LPAFPRSESTSFGSLDITVNLRMLPVMVDSNYPSADAFQEGRA
jgi:hypothetical protein